MDFFDLTPAARSTFNQFVWKIARQVPPGKVSTYGQIAAYIPQPAGVDPDTYQAYRARWVGSSMAACPPDVPWQRVINAQGKISQRSGAEGQRRMLEGEGVVFDPRERVDLARFGWEGPGADWLLANNLLPGEDKA